MKTKRLSKPQQLSVDRITTLPQAIIETILCLLPIEEAARTSILSREWRYKWTTIPKLAFYWHTVSKRTTKGIDWKKPISWLEMAKRDKDRRCKLFYAIHQVLLWRQGPIIEFTLSMNADHSLFEIDQIIFHLSRNHTVKKLTLDFGYSIVHGLPLSVFSLHHLTDLYLQNCDINHKPIIGGFSSLTSLSLDSSSNTRISRETLLHLLTNCPSLKSLCLFVREESFHGYEKPNIVDLFKCLPVIEHLTIWGRILPLLVQASIPEEHPPSLIHLKYLCIEELDFANDYGLNFLAVLIKCSPNLEKIKLVSDTEDQCDGRESAKLREYSNVWLEHLNELEIKYFTNKKHEIEFVKFILARSPNLKKVRLLTIIICKNEALEILNILLRSPRASPVEIFVENLCQYHFG